MDCVNLQDAVAALRQDTDHDRHVPLTEIRFLPPIPNPRKIICVGLNYPKPYPVDGVVPPKPDNIILFGKERDEDCEMNTGFANLMFGLCVTGPIALVDLAYLSGFAVNWCTTQKLRLRCEYIYQFSRRAWNARLLYVLVTLPI